MKTEISNEFILEAHKEACSTWKARIEKECPELFKNILQEGKWYKRTDNKAIFCITGFYEKNFGAYGFNFKGEWAVNKYDFGTIDFDLGTTVLATEQEVKEALINEAKKRGYDKGVSIKECLQGGDYNAKLKNGFTFSFDYGLWSYSYTNGQNVCIFKDGKWAEIIQQPTEIELIKAEIERLNERLNKLL